ncbi:hypothetical protein GOBAR_AA36282 [Gossypium barbadense]|uniref:Uncharacterized protein n=1 Tax=Gossypium barbadense TaxID=3634 RepID=A0A2P5W028_GOSBA|nr:hypothetical protein GOBAR_AA36282 [Gossypium barbadense]
MCANVLVVMSSLQHAEKQKDLKWLTVWKARLLAILPAIAISKIAFGIYFDDIGIYGTSVAICRYGYFDLMDV